MFKITLWSVITFLFFVRNTPWIPPTGGYVELALTKNRTPSRMREANREPSQKGTSSTLGRELIKKEKIK